MIVARQHTQTTSFVKIPQPQSLVITRGQNPGKLSSIGVEFHRTDVIQVPQKGEEATPKLVIPNLDLVIITAGDDEGFVEVKIHAAYGAVMFFEAVDDGSDSVVPPEDY